VSSLVGNCLTGCPPINLSNCISLYTSQVSNKTGIIYGYNFSANTSTPLPIANLQTTNMIGLANTSNKLWTLSSFVSGQNFLTIREWNISLTPFTSTFSRNITLPLCSTCIDVRSGLFAISNTSLLTVTGNNTTQVQSVVTLDITTTAATMLKRFDLPSNRKIANDLIYNSSANKVIISTYDTGLTKNYISQYTLGGTLEFDIQLNLSTFTGVIPNNNGFSLLVNSGNLYIVQSGDNTKSRVARISLTSPYGLTYLPTINLVGNTKDTSQNSDCVNVQFT
jgi:hypothetical protein